MDVDDTHARRKVIRSRLRISAPLPQDFVDMCEGPLNIALPEDLTRRRVELLADRNSPTMTTESARKSLGYEGSLDIRREQD